MKAKVHEAWSDPILDEIHRVREEMVEEMAKDRRAFLEKMHKEALAAGVKFANLKPLPFPSVKRK